MELDMQQVISIIWAGVNILYKSFQPLIVLMEKSVGNPAQSKLYAFGWLCVSKLITLKVIMILKTHPAEVDGKL